MDLPYEGALLPDEALTLLQEAPDAKLVDVRSRAEWDWVGRIPGAVEMSGSHTPVCGTTQIHQLSFQPSR